MHSTQFFIQKFNLIEQGRVHKFKRILKKKKEKKTNGNKNEKNLNSEDKNKLVAKQCFYRETLPNVMLAFSFYNQPN